MGNLLSGWESVEESPLSVIENIRMGKFIEKGAFGTVYDVSKCAKPDPKKYALKVDYKRDNIGLRLSHEANPVCVFSHRNMLKALIVDDKHLLLVTEYMEEGTLRNRLVRREKIVLDLSQFYEYLFLNGLKYIHSQGTVHQLVDLNTADILPSSNECGALVKLSDSERSKNYQRYILGTGCETSISRDAEIIRNNGKVKKWMNVVFHFLLLAEIFAVVYFVLPSN